ncbi:hypothetical protein C2S51_016717, partial [Perilla frutescens var. frutescens]
MEVIIASHIIKPSSPTPIGFKHHKLSYLDQIVPPFYVPLIFFYEHDETKHHEEISRHLKQSLSEILTVFYPLAGTIKQNSFVDCDDSGAEFTEARVPGYRLAQLIQNPKMEELEQLIPIDSISHNDNAILSVKTSFFDCGGISVGVCLSHKIVDAASFVMFMNAWAATCRGESSRIIHPSFDLALHFPPMEHSFSPSGVYAGIKREKMVTKRLVLEREKIEKLREEAAASSSVKDPTRVEAVSAFIWRSFLEAAATKETPPWSSVASHVVNVRPRTVPPMPAHTFGNCNVFASAVASSSSSGDDRVSKFRAAIRAVDDDYITKVVKHGDYFGTTLGIEALPDPRSCLFSSWWRFPAYDVDFGWGKPVWVCTTTMPVMNGIVLMSTPSGDGME